jgi:hypothetical protein
MPPDALWPTDGAFFARNDLARLPLTGYTDYHIDSVTLNLMGLMGHRPAVRHISGATDAIRQALTDAGLPGGEETLTYATGAEAERHAATLRDRGFRFITFFPLPPDRWPEAAQVVPPALWNALNAKANLGDLVPSAHLPLRAVMTRDTARARTWDGPVWVKSAGPSPTGGGFAVRPVTDPADWPAALDALAALPDTDTLVVEEHVPVTSCWAVQIGITDAGTRYGGSAEQTFATPGEQDGSLHDAANPFPAPELAIAVGEAARQRGFRGIAGLDIGQAEDGRLIVFDPNFRTTSSTSIAMFAPAAMARAGLPVALTVDVFSTMPMEQMIAATRGPVADGWFVPTRMLDATLFPPAKGLSRVSGFVLASDRAAAARVRDDLTRILGA